MFKGLRLLVGVACVLFTNWVIASTECVVLLHGLHLNKNAMSALEKSLRNDGYKTVNRSYRSTDYSIDVLAGQIDTLVNGCGRRKVHFVTHSMGGIVLRRWLKTKRPLNFGRVVMLAPPNNGSELADILGNLYAFQLLFGPAGQELGTKPDATPRSLGPANFDVGIIAGNRSMFPHFSDKMPGPDDGIVTVESTKLRGMSDHIVLPVSHVSMVINSNVIRQTKHFLRVGKFNRSNSKTGN